MQTHLRPEFTDTPDGEEAQAISGKCVHPLRFLQRNLSDVSIAGR